jgi:hypothetical protein
MPKGFTPQLNTEYRPTFMYNAGGEHFEQSCATCSETTPKALLFVTPLQRKAGVDEQDFCGHSGNARQNRAYNRDSDVAISQKEYD